MRASLFSVFILLQFLSISQVDTLRVEKKTDLEDDFQTQYDELTEIIELDSMNVSALLSRADLISGMDDDERFYTVFGNMEIYDKALADYNKALEISPYAFRTYYKRAKLKERFLLLEEALDDYDEAYTYAWGKASKSKTRVNRAWIKSKLGFKDVALKELEKALIEDREHIGILNTLAMVHLDLEQYSEALKYLNRSLEFLPEDPITLSNVGFVALNSGKFEQAIKIYDEQIEKDSTFSFMFSNRGLAKYKLGNIEEALLDIGEAIRLNPINTFAWKNRAIINFDLGKNEEGCADLQKAKDFGFTILHGDEVIKTLFDKCFSVNKKPK